MPLTYSITDDFVILTAREDTGSEELLQVLHAVTAERSCADPAKVLLSAPGLTESTPTVEAQRIASILASHVNRVSRTALVAASGRCFAQGQMIETYCRLAGVEFRVFLERETAASWLEQPQSSRQVRGAKNAREKRLPLVHDPPPKTPWRHR